MLHVISLLVLPCLVTCAVISSTDTENENFRSARQDDGKLKSTTNSISDCLGREYFGMGNCFGVKAIALLNRASRMSTITLGPGFTLTADNDELQQRSGKALISEEEIENSISSDPNEKGSKLVDMLLDSVSYFFQTHSLQLRIPKSASSEFQRALDEGRGKLKKKWLPYMSLVAVKVFSFLPLLLGVIGYFALKALIVGKIALIIATILALQKYSFGSFNGFGKLSDGFNGAGSSYSQYGPAGYYRRSIEDQAAAQQLAYNGHDPHQHISTSS